MSVYLNTFRTEHKVATLGGSTVKVYAYRYLCRANDADEFARDRRFATLMQAQCEQAQGRFDTLRPVYAACVFEDHWDGAQVYTALPGASHYDTESLSKEPVGFLTKDGRGWAITTEHRGEDSPMVAGHTFTRRYIERLGVDIPYSMTATGYRCHTNGAELTVEAFEAWRVMAVAEYVAKCQAAQVARDAQAAEHQRLIQAQRDAKNAEIQAARDTLTRLEQERCAIR